MIEVDGRSCSRHRPSVVGFSYYMPTHDTTLEYLTTTKIGEKGQLTVPKALRRRMFWLRFRRRVRAFMHGGMQRRLRVLRVAVPAILELLIPAHPIFAASERLAAHPARSRVQCPDWRDCFSLGTGQSC